MVRISLARILRALQRTKLPDCELVVGIAQGGIVPAVLVAAQTGSNLKIIQINYRNRDNLPQHPRPVLLKRFKPPKQVRRILLVDDASVSGQTLRTAKKQFKGYRVKTMVFKGRADIVLFPEVQSCVHWPWRF